MILIKADHDRRIEIPGVPAPVRRPVDIDQAITGFTGLRTLRMYRFDQGSVIEGHAEEDEVFVVVMAGSVEIAITADSSSEISATPVTLSAPRGLESGACAAYLPPHAAYKLVALADADVAYARATPVSIRPPRVFFARARAVAPGTVLCLEETGYAERLRLRLVHFDVQQDDLSFAPIHEPEAMCECLVHLGTVTPADKEVAAVDTSGAARLQVNSWDTVALSPGERMTLSIASGSTGLALIVMAK